MVLQAAPFFFIVRVNKEQQENTRQFDGGLAVSPNYVFMQHETQNGEIVSIGTMAKQMFPTVKIGNTLIFHHFVTGKGIEDKEDSPYLILSDEIHNYYNVTATSYNGERNMTYGFWDGKNVVPHKDFIFLELETKVKEVVTNDSCLQIKNWSESRDQKGVRMNEIKNTITELSKTKASEDLKHEIEKREKIMNSMSKEINKKQVNIYNVAYSQTDFKEVGMLNMACNTTISFMGKEYIIAPTKFMYFGTSEN